LNQGTIPGKAAIYLLILVVLAAIVFGIPAVAAVVVYVNTHPNNRVLAFIVFLTLAEFIFLGGTFWWLRLRRQQVRRGQRPAIRGYAKHIKWYEQASVWAMCVGVQVVFFSWPLWHRRAGLVPGAVTTALLVFGIGASTYSQGRKMATDVARGKEVSGRILNVRAYDVQIALCDGAPPNDVDVSKQYVFLGEGKEWLVLFDRVEQRTIRIPSGKAVVKSVQLEGLKSDTTEATQAENKLLDPQAYVEYMRAKSEAEAAATQAAKATLERLDRH
jgi:hypothetical protein